MKYSMPKILAKLLFAIIYISFISHATYLTPRLGLAAEIIKPPMAKPASAILLPQDCQKCHSNIAVMISEKGMAHRDKVTCVACHEGHPPRKRDIIPSCSKCHHKTKDTPHFGLTNCLHCHQNPHTPLVITLTRQMTAPCLTCHKSQIKELRKFPSIHTTLDCTACHIKHGFKPECFACHAPHLKRMTLADCLGCHRPHMPLMVTYGPETPSEFCGSCHDAVYNLLARSNAKHRNVQCVRCHEAKHKTIPKCQKCHNLPHTSAIHTKFPNCGTCHGIAHSLKLNQIDIFMEKNQTPN